MKISMKFALGLAVTLLLTVAAGAQQSSPVKATLVIPDTKLLPGVPFDMWIDVINTSDTAVTIGLYPVLVVQQNGETFEIAPPLCDVPVLLPPVHQAREEYQYLQLAPGEKKTLIPPVEQAPYFITDYRIMPPGHYMISFRIDAFPDILASHAPTPLTYHGAVVTNAVSFDRIVPTGSDAKVWELMQKASKDGHWTLPQFTEVSGCRPRIPNNEERYSVYKEIVTNYPDSNYYPYAVGTTFPKSRREALLRDAIHRFPHTPVLEYLHLGLWRRDGFTDSDQEEHKRLIEGSKRPTTRFAAFGREDLPKEPCPPDYDCDDDQ